MLRQLNFLRFLLLPIFFVEDRILNFKTIVVPLLLYYSFRGGYIELHFALVGRDKAGTECRILKTDTKQLAVVRILCLRNTANGRYSRNFHGFN